ncbi:MAG: hypothetical protein ACE5Q6_08720 [Dehalococcoidia bacterium]
MDLEAIKEELIEGLMSLDNALAPYRMVAHAVSELGAPELVSAYHGYTSLHEIYQQVVEEIKAAETPEEVVEAYRRLNPQVPVEEGVTGI